MATGKASKASKGTAARKEKAVATKKLKWKGLTLEVPAQMPERAFARFEFDRVMMDVDASRPAYQLLRSIIGDEQFLVARNALDSFNDINTLLDCVMEVYGLTVGESGASQVS